MEQNTQTTTAPATKSTLDLRQMYQLAEKIKANREYIMREKPPYLKLAEIMTDEMGIKVSRFNVKSAMRMLDMQYQPKARKGRKAQCTNRKLDAVCYCLQRLFARVNLPVPDCLAEAFTEPATEIGVNGHIINKT